MGPPGNRRAPRGEPNREPKRARVTFGEVELVPDPVRPRGWTLLVDEVPQSYVDLDDPDYLEFGYMRQLGRVLRLWQPHAVRPNPPERTAVLHLGGGGLTLARLLDHQWPGASQRVVERDPELIEFVARELPIPAGIEVEAGDALTALREAASGAYDVIVADVSVGAAIPARIASAGFAAAAAHALAPGGLYLMNVTDVPPLAWTRVQVATLQSAFVDVALLGDAAVVRGRRSGNVILPAGNVPMIRPDKHERVLRGADLAEFVGGAKARGG